MKTLKQDLLGHYEEMKQLKAVMDADVVHNEGKDSIIAAYSEAVNAAFLRLQRIIKDIDSCEKQRDKAQSNTDSL